MSRTRDSSHAGAARGGIGARDDVAGIQLRVRVAAGSTLPVAPPSPPQASEPAAATATVSRLPRAAADVRGMDTVGDAGSAHAGEAPHLRRDRQLKSMRASNDPWLALLHAQWRHVVRTPVNPVLRVAVGVPLYPLLLCWARCRRPPSGSGTRLCWCCRRRDSGRGQARARSSRPKRNERSYLGYTASVLALDIVRVTVWALVAAPVWLGAWLAVAAALGAPNRDVLDVLDALRTSVDVYVPLLLVWAALIMNATHK